MFHLFAVRPLLLSPLLGCLLLFVACSEATNGTGLISQKIGALAHDPGNREVHLAKLTSFGWDRFYVIRSGASREEVCEFIGANREHCGRIIRYTTVPPDSVALVFALGDQLTHTELHALANGQFELTPVTQATPREEAVFVIHRSSAGAGADRISLELKR